MKGLNGHLERATHRTLPGISRIDKRVRLYVRAEHRVSVTCCIHETGKIVGTSDVESNVSIGNKIIQKITVHRLVELFSTSKGEMDSTRLVRILK